MLHIIANVYDDIFCLEVFQLTIVAYFIDEFFIENILKPFVQMVVTGYIEWSDRHCSKDTNLVLIPKNAYLFIHCFSDRLHRYSSTRDSVYVSSYFKSAISFELLKPTFVGYLISVV